MRLDLRAAHDTILPVVREGLGALRKALAALDRRLPAHVDFWDAGTRKKDLRGWNVGPAGFIGS